MSSSATTPEEELAKLDGKIPTLTLVQHEVLAWSSHGVSYDQIGLLIERSPASVRNTAKEVLRKLRAESMTHAVARALRIGLLK